MKFIYINAITVLLIIAVIIFYSYLTHQIKFLGFEILFFTKAYYFLQINRKVKQLNFIMRPYINSFNKIDNEVVVKSSEVQNS